MRFSGSRRLGSIAVGFALTCTFLGVSASSALAAYDPSDPAQKAEHDQALAVGTQGYVYGRPVLNTERVFQTHTSVNVCDGRGHGPVNQFCAFRNLADPNDRTVVAPNTDGLYTAAFLDLKPMPQVIHVPDTGSRFNVVPLLSPWQENFAIMGNGASDILPPGDYVVKGPGSRGFHCPSGRHCRAWRGRDRHRRGWRGRVHGLTVIDSPYDRVWIIMRTELNGPQDLDAVHAIQSAATITPLNKWGKKKPYVPPVPKHPDTTLNEATIPGTQPGEDPLDFFDALNAEMGRFQPPAADQPMLDQLATVGIGPGLKKPSKNHKLSDATLAGLRDSVAAGQAKIDLLLKQEVAAGFTAHNGYLIAAIGNYGTNYNLRAIVDKVGLGALPTNVAIYALGTTDRLGAQLNGATKRYVAHVNAPSGPLPHLPIPPIPGGFWSLTMYDADFFFFPNPLDRWVLNKNSDLHYNADGSLDFYLQTGAPTDPDQLKNWLPAPAGPFNLIWRLPSSGSVVQGILDGTAWKAATVLPCLASGSTAAGWACAS